MPELPPDGPEDLPRVVPFRREGEPRDVRPPPVVTWASSFPAEPRERLFHVDGLIPTKHVTLLYGDGAVGKSLLILQLLASTALGKPWMGLEVAGGIALMVTAEDDLDEVQRRAADIARAEGVSVQDLHRLAIISLAGEDAVLARANKAGVLETTPLYAQIEAILRDLRPALLALDTLADLFAGNENDRGLARQFIGLLRRWTLRYDTTIVLLAHPSLSGLNSGSGLSGSTAWNNSVRSRLYFERVKSDEDGSEPDPNARLLRTMKANYAPQDTEIRLRWRNGVFVPEATSSLASYVTREHAQELFLKLLESYVAQGRSVSPDPSPTYAPALFAKDPRADGITKTGFRNAMNALFEAQRIKVTIHGPKSHQRQRLVLA